jgi:hypothetical protein
MNFYSYFPAMKEDPKMKGKYWGNQFFPARRFLPARGQWHCFEIMLRVNDVDRENGEQAAWIDGKLYAHFIGIEWRKSDQVRIKRMTLGVYIHDNPKRNVVHFDDVALSTGYIGPIAKQGHRLWGQALQRDSAGPNCRLYVSRAVDSRL